MRESARTLFAELIDYAGLFPPAGLDLPTTVANYAAYVASDHAWMLGRLIVPVGRLDEFADAATGRLPTGEDDMPWMLSALLPPLGEADLDRAVDDIERFNAGHSSPVRGMALIDTIETRAATASMIDHALDALPDGLVPFFEIASSGDPRGMIAALAGSPGRAKIRTGGVETTAIPPTRDVLGFILTCAAAGVPFKATAGLHHPLRAAYPLTYAADAPVGLMHGFLNVFIAAAAVRSNLIDEPDAADLLDEPEAAAFTFTDDGVAWRGLRLGNEHLALARGVLAISFGSCSFEEPVADLIRLNIL